MRQSQPSPAIVYSTGISMNIQRAFKGWDESRRKYGKNATCTNAAYLKFASACEREHKDTGFVVKKLA